MRFKIIFNDRLMLMCFLSLLCLSTMTINTNIVYAQLSTLREHLETHDIGCPSFRGGQCTCDFSDQSRTSNGNPVVTPGGGDSGGVTGTVESPPINNPVTQMPSDSTKEETYRGYLFEGRHQYENYFQPGAVFVVDLPTPDDWLNVRSSIWGNIIGGLGHGQRVRIASYEKRYSPWVRIWFRGHPAYIYSKLIVPEQYYGNRFNVQPYEAPGDDDQPDANLLIPSDGQSSPRASNSTEPVNQAAAAAGVAASVTLATLFMNIAQRPITGTGAPPVLSSGPPVNEQGQVFYKPPWDEGGAYWMNGDEYRHMQDMQAQGKVWSNDYGWQDPADLANYRGQVQNQRDYMDERYQTLLQEQEELKLRRQDEAERLEDYLAGREGVDISDLDLDEEMKSAFESLRKEHQEYRETRKAAIEEQMEITQADAEYYKKVAHRWDMAAKGAQMVKNAADKTIDVTAKVTGYKGKQIRRAYRAVSNLAGGLSEGYATGEYSRSMLEATGRIMDGEIGDRLGGKTKRAAQLRVYHQVGGDMVRGGYQGYLNMGKGETVLGAISLGALEGGASSTSGLIGGTLKGADKVVYSAYEEMFKAGYNHYKMGGNFQTMQKDMAFAGIESLVDSGVDKVFDHLLPRTSVTNQDEMLKHIQKIVQELPDDVEAKRLIAALTDDYVKDNYTGFLQDYAYDSFIEMNKETLKGEGLITYYQNFIKLF